jgi:hypothetical protein
MAVSAAAAFLMLQLGWDADAAFKYLNTKLAQADIVLAANCFAKDVAAWGDAGCLLQATGQVLFEEYINQLCGDGAKKKNIRPRSVDGVSSSATQLLVSEQQMDWLNGLYGRLTVKEDPAYGCGGVIWDGAICLTDFISRHAAAICPVQMSDSTPSIFACSSSTGVESTYLGIELGAGTGCVGIVASAAIAATAAKAAGTAARAAAGVPPGPVMQMHLTDWSRLVPLLEHNIRTNKQHIARIEAEAKSVGCTDGQAYVRCSAGPLEWGVAEGSDYRYSSLASLLGEGGNGEDGTGAGPKAVGELVLILGSDISYDTDARLKLGDTLRELCALATSEGGATPCILLSHVERANGGPSECELVRSELDGIVDGGRAVTSTTTMTEAGDTEGGLAIDAPPLQTTGQPVKTLHASTVKTLHASLGLVCVRAFACKPTVWEEKMWVHIWTNQPTRFGSKASEHVGPAAVSPCGCCDVSDR